MPCRRRLLPAAAAVLLAAAVLATPASYRAAHAETTTADAAPSEGPGLDLLRAQPREPDRTVHAEPCGPSTRAQDCDGVRCLWDYLSQKVRTAAERLGGDVEELADFIAYSHDDTLPIPKDDDDDDDADDDDDDDIEWVDQGSDRGVDTQETTPLDGHGARVNGNPDMQEGTHRLDNGDDDGDGSYPHQPPLLMTVALAAIAIGYFSFWGIHHLHRRTARLCLQHQSLPTVSSEHLRRRGDSRSARRARRKVQQQAITRCVRGALRRWTRGNTAAGEGKRAVGGKPMKVPAGETSTMEEDIAHLREVANFIDDVVAAERGMPPSGRSDTLLAPTPCVTEAPSLPPSGRDFIDQDHCLLTYDVVAEGQPLVANDFMHAPSSSTRSEGGDRPETTNNQGA